MRWFVGTRILTRAAVAGLGAALVACAVTGTKPPAAGGAALVEFTAPDALVRLGRSQHRIDFAHLANQFEGQSNKAFCGPTTAVIVMNALRADNGRIEKPQDPSLLPAEFRAGLPQGFDPLYRRYTQQNLFTPPADRVKTRAEILGRPAQPGAKPDAGVQLRQLHALLGSQGLASTLRVVDDTLSDAVIRRELVDNLATAADYVIVNFLRSALGQEGGGHISPLGAYDAATDSFLILDVNPNGRRWVWAPAGVLIGAMRTRDTVENRGYLLVREGAP